MEDVMDGEAMNSLNWTGAKVKRKIERGEMRKEMCLERLNHGKKKWRITRTKKRYQLED